MRLNNRGNWTLIGLLAAVAIVVIVGVIYFGGQETTTVKSDSELLDPHSQKQTTVGKAMDTAKATDCQERLRQIRLGIEQSKITNETNPPTLQDIGLGVSNDYFQCPVSNQPYSYDAASGAVKCPTHTQY